MPYFTRRRLLTSLGVIGAATGFGITRAMPFTYHDGPITRHFDGVRFSDPNGMPPKGFADQWRWYREGGKAKWPEWVENEFSDTPPARVTGNAWRISHVGHASARPRRAPGCGAARRAAEALEELARKPV